MPDADPPRHAAPPQPHGTGPPGWLIPPTRYLGIPKPEIGPPGQRNRFRRRLNIIIIVRFDQALTVNDLAPKSAFFRAGTFVSRVFATQNQRAKAISATSIFAVRCRRAGDFLSASSKLSSAPADLGILTSIVCAW